MDKSPNRKESVIVVEQFQEKYPCANLTLFSQNDRLHWSQNVNFLLEKAKGEYVTFIPVDDVIPPGYISRLAECLDRDSSAANCYPVLSIIDKGDTGRRISQKKIMQPSVSGSQHERIDQALNVSAIVSFRGLVRRAPHGSFRPFSIPRLFKNFYWADKAQFIRHAIAGAVKRVDVGYGKVYRGNSIHNSMLKKGGTFSSDDIWQAALQLHATLYDDAHSFATTSEKTFLSLSSSLTKYLNSLDYDVKLQDVALKLMEKITQKKRVAILGGGIQGCLMALMFRKHGYDVSIYDKSSDVMNRASATGEGKVRLRDKGRR